MSRQSQKSGELLEVSVDKLVHGGQGLGTLPDGKKALVWNTLPGEIVRFRPLKTKSSFIEGIAEEILKVSPEREKSRDELYLSTSPWQMMSYEAENKYKKEILQESLQRSGIECNNEIEFIAPKDPWHYRNKMEYSFWGDDDGLHLALFNRGTHRKQIVSGSSLARPEIDEAANQICRILNEQSVRAGDLKSLIIRCNQAGECVAALFTRREDFPKIRKFSDIAKGVAVYFSNPKSPASVPTRQLYKAGDTTLTDNLLGRTFQYDVLSFFQVNLEAYTKALQAIKTAVGSNFVTDMYAGVGTIGLSVSERAPWLVESDSHSAAMARLNVKNSGFKDAVVEVESEKATEYINCGEDSTVIFDPPRAGLHQKVIEATNAINPGQVIYLSCNPSTLERDLKIFDEYGTYQIKSVTGYNFFPRTPHIEALAILESE